MAGEQAIACGAWVPQLSRSCIEKCLVTGVLPDDAKIGETGEAGEDTPDGRVRDTILDGRSDFALPRNS